MSWRLWYRETANHHEIDKDYFAFVPPKNDRLHYIGSSEPSPALSASSTLTTSSSRSTRQFSPVSFIRFISSLSPDHSLKDLLRDPKLKMETTTTITTAGINLVRQPTDLEISKAECAPPLTQQQQIEKKDKGRDKGEHDILNTYQQYNKDNIIQDIILPTTVITTPADERPEPTLTRHKSNHTRCSKMFFIKSDDESEGGQKQQQHHDRSLPRRSFRLPPHPPPPPAAAAGPPTVTPHQQHVKESLQRTSSISSSLGSITDYDSDFYDDDDNEDDDDDQEDDPLFPSNDGPRTADSFHKKPTLLKHQRSLLSDMLSHKATTAVSKSRPIPPPSAATTIRPPSADPFMTKELSESLRRNVQWEQSQKRLCYFKCRTAAPPLKPDNPSLTDDEFQGW